MYSTMKLIIAGTRSFSDYELLKQKCDFFLKNTPHPIEIVSGGAPGADYLGEQYAIHNQYPVTRFPADWKTHGRAAGAIRNAAMAKYATHCIVFWDGKSPGTKIMIDLATKHNLPIKIIHYLYR